MAGCHAQTLGAYFFKGKQAPYSAISSIVDLFDGDRLVVHDDKPDSWITGDRIVVLLHGLCGCHGSPYMVRTASKLNRAGVRTIRVDMRGFGDSTLDFLLAVTSCYERWENGPTNWSRSWIRRLQFAHQST